MRLWEGFSVERRVAVARPMPEDPPVMRIVLGDEDRVCRVEVEGVKSDIFGGSGGGGLCLYGDYMGLFL
jgi:hypothetical protein